MVTFKIHHLVKVRCPFILDNHNIKLYFPYTTSWLGQSHFLDNLDSMMQITSLRVKLWGAWSIRLLDRFVLLLYSSLTPLFCNLFVCVFWNKFDWLPCVASKSLKEYEEKAVSLALNRPKLQDLTNRLKAARLTCPLFDTARWVSLQESSIYLSV